MSFRGVRFFLLPALVIDLLLASTVVSYLNSMNFCSSPFNCSNSTPILFPFSSLNSSCGFNLISCNGNVTKIRLFDSDFIVKRITYLDRSIEVRYPAAYETKLCSSPQNFTLSGRLLTSGIRVFGVNLTFFKCNSANDWLLRPPSSWKRKDCADGSLLYYYYSPQEQIKLPLNIHRLNCSMYEIPAGVEESVSANLSAILSGGFFLRWSFDCLECNTSGGKCVFGEDDAPACYCKDGSVNHKNCSDGSSSKSAGGTWGIRPPFGYRPFPTNSEPVDTNSLDSPKSPSLNAIVRGARKARNFSGEDFSYCLLVPHPISQNFIVCYGRFSLQRKFDLCYCGKNMVPACHC